MDTFTRAYITAALWSSTDADGAPLDRDFAPEDIAPESMARMEADCAAFQSANADHIGAELEQAGHDFWLTRNRHGAGYWDGDWAEDAGARLTAAAHAAGECALYEGDDGKLYLS